MSTPAYTISLSAEQYNAEQIELMEERLILLSHDDEAIGEGSKKDCTSNSLRALPTGY
jgi:isopentenyl-diphosphate delta-isomerase